MASLNGLKLINISCEEYIDDTEFIFGELYFNKPVGEFVRRRKVPQYAQYEQFANQYMPSYMYMSTADTSFTWYDDVNQDDIINRCEQTVGEMNPKAGSSVIRLIDCLFHLLKVEQTWRENNCVPVQCVWNNKAYRIYGLEGTDALPPFGKAIQKIAKGFAHDFGLAKVSWFENDEDFDLCDPYEQPSIKNVQFAC